MMQSARIDVVATDLRTQSPDTLGLGMVRKPAVPSISRIFGVDFSGAKLAGENIWIASCSVGENQSLTLDQLASVASLASSPLREDSHRYLVDQIKKSSDAIWGIDFPFGLPVELGWASWQEQLSAVGQWRESVNDFGRSCVARALTLGPKLHIRRRTDSETSTPFDSYHYRIIYQTFYGMRDVLARLQVDNADMSTCILPFEVNHIKKAKRIVVEACPGSTLRRLKLPYNRYKRPTGGPLDAKQRANRHRILEGIESRIHLSSQHTRTLMRNPGGDALDAVIAAMGVWDHWNRLDLPTIATHARYRHEGLVFC